jgi:hypothetical protein
MNTEKTKEELRAELDSNRERIDALKAETKRLREEGEKKIAAAKERGISLTVEPYSRGFAVVDAYRTYGNGDTFTVSDFVNRLNDIAVRNGEKDNIPESGIVFRSRVLVLIRLGLVEKTGKDSYRKTSGAVLRKTGTE